MSVDSTDDLLLAGLKHAYYTEQQLVDVLEVLEDTSDREALEEGFAEHREETEGHVDRLEQVFETLGVDAEAETDPVAEGLVEAHTEFLEKDPDEDVLDRFNIAAGQKSEHYEIATYENLVTLAEAEGRSEAADLLQQNLQEERDELETLEQKAVQFDQDELTA